MDDPELSHRAHFEPWALGGTVMHGENDHPKWWTLDSLMKLNGACPHPCESTVPYLFHHKADFFPPRSVDQVTRSSTSSKLTLKAANLTRSRRSSPSTLGRPCPSANFKSRFTRARVTSDLTSLPSGGNPWRRRACDPSGRSQTWCTSTLCAVHDRSWRRCVSFFFFGSLVC